MDIKIDTQLGTVRVDLTTDIDHLARYRLFLAEKVGGVWKELPGSVLPPFSTSRDPEDHQLTPLPAKLPGQMIQVSARVNSLVKNPGSLYMNLRVYQDMPFNPAVGTQVSAVATYPIDYHDPVPFGQEKRIVVSFLFV